MHHNLRTLFAATCIVLFAQATVAAETHTIYQVTILSDAGAAGRSVDHFGVVAGRYTLPNNVRHASVWAFGRQIDRPARHQQLGCTRANAVDRAVAPTDTPSGSGTSA
jgi:hypothetical protein